LEDPRRHVTLSLPAHTPLPALSQSCCSFTFPKADALATGPDGVFRDVLRWAETAHRSLFPAILRPAAEAAKLLTAGSGVRSWLRCQLWRASSYRSHDLFSHATFLHPGYARQVLHARCDPLVQADSCFAFRSAEVRFRVRSFRRHRGAFVSINRVLSLRPNRMPGGPKPPEFHQSPRRPVCPASQNRSARSPPWRNLLDPLRSIRSCLGSAVLRPPGAGLSDACATLSKSASR